MWNLFRRFARHTKSDIELLPMIEMAAVHYVGGRMVIASIHRDVKGGCPAGPPLQLIGTDEAAERVGETVLAALSASRDGLTEQESAEIQKAVFAELGVPSWEVAEKKYQLVNIAEARHEKGFVEVVPMQRCRAGGYVCNDAGSIVRCPRSAEPIGSAVLAMVRGNQPDDFIEAPSHT